MTVNLKKNFFFFVLVFSVTASSFDLAQIGKISSRKLGTPLARQGSCLLFQSGNLRFCATVYHVAETTDSEDFQYAVKTQSGETLNLKFLVAEWGLGLSLYQVTSETKMKFTDFEQLDWAADPVAAGADVIGIGFPVTSAEVNTTFGTYIKKSVEAAKDLFIMVPEVILISDMPSEVGLSGGVLIDEKEKILGLLSHQVVEDKKVSTMALPTSVVKKWLSQSVTAFNEKRKYQTYFMGSESQTTDSEYFSIKAFDVFFSIQQFLPRERTACCSSPVVNISQTKDRNGFFPKYKFPVFTKLAAIFSELNQKIDALSRADVAQADQNFYHKNPYFLGCSTSDTMVHADETFIYKKALEVIHGFKDIALRKTPCKDLVFLNTGGGGHRVGDASWRLFKHWQEHFEKADLSSVAVWKKRWVDLIQFYFVGRTDQYQALNGTDIAWKTTLQLEDYLIQDEPRQQAYDLYPAEVLQLEQLMKILIEAHQRAVYRVPASKLFDVTGESSDWLLLFSSAPHESASEK